MQRRFRDQDVSADLLAAARAQPGKLSFGHAGNGTSSHLAGELVKYMAKVDMASVPYRGGAPGTQRSHRRAHPALGQQRAGVEGAARRGRRAARSA